MSESEVLDARPGWATLREAADELHAAALLAGDPLARPAAAVPHLRAFWRSITAAALAAGIGAGEQDPETVAPEAWLEAGPPGLDPRARKALLDQLRSLAREQPPSKRELRAQVAAARSLLATLEPEIGGEPLRRRKRLIAWAVVAAALILTPVALYVALHTEVPGTGPWRAAYHADTAFESRPVLVREDSVEHDWKDTAPHEKIAPDKFAVRWDTCLRLD
ncbi:MAG: hypothetical protein R6X02_13670, partial [Enhygromyxa sp.]